MRAGGRRGRRRSAHYNLGLAFRQKGYYAEALREYRLALERGEDRRLVLQAMAEVHLLRRDLGRRSSCTTTLVREHPDSPEALERARRVPAPGRAARRGARRPTSARSPLDRDLRARLEQPRRAAGARGRHRRRAIAAFRARAAACSRRSHAARLNLALLLLQRRRLQPALEAYRAGAARDQPTNAAAWNGVGLVLMELKRYADARNAFAPRGGGRPGTPAAHYNLSFTLSTSATSTARCARPSARSSSIRTTSRRSSS